MFYLQFINIFLFTFLQPVPKDCSGVQKFIFRIFATFTVCASTKSRKKYHLHKCWIIEAKQVCLKRGEINIKVFIWKMSNIVLKFSLTNLYWLSSQISVEKVFRLCLEMAYLRTSQA